jgi:hypothetical protein
LRSDCTSTAGEARHCPGANLALPLGMTAPSITGFGKVLHLHRHRHPWPGWHMLWLSTAAITTLVAAGVASVLALRVGQELTGLFVTAWPWW